MRIPTQASFVVAFAGACLACGVRVTPSGSDGGSSSEGTEATSSGEAGTEAPDLGVTTEETGDSGDTGPEETDGEGGSPDLPVPDGPCEGDDVIDDTVAVLTPEDLEALEGVRCITDELRIYADVPDLAPLWALESVYGLQLGEYGEPGGPVTVTGLENLRTARHIDVFAPTLTSLQGLEGIETLPDGLTIVGSGLVDLSGLEGLTSALDVLIGDYPTTQSPDVENTQLVSLAGLESLTEVTGGVSIRANPVLSNLSGIANLEQIGASLRVNLNPQLTELGLDQLHSVGSLVFLTNPLLPSCDIEALVEQTGTPPVVARHNLDDGCAGPGDCDPMDAHAEGICEAFFGYWWNGSTCTGESGCECVGDECIALLSSIEECEAAFGTCS